MGNWYTYALVMVFLIALGLLATPAYADEFSLTYTNQCASFMIPYFSPGFFFVSIAVPIGSGVIMGGLYNFSGPATLIVQANVSSSSPVELAFGPAVNQTSVNITWSTSPSTTINGTYTINVPNAGQYYLGIYNPSVPVVFAIGYVNVTACGDAQFVSDWLNDTTAPYSSPLGLPMNPVGIVANGIMEVNGQLRTYTLTTDAVEGIAYIPSNVNASDYYPDGSYYGNAFSVQLNAYVVAKLANGQTQYYFVHNTAAPGGGQLWVWDNVWNATTYIPNLNPANIRGGGNVYFSENLNLFYYEMPNPVPSGQVTLEISVHTKDGSIVIDFYVDGHIYDTVTITPDAPATSASIVIAPAESPQTTPLDLELVFTGYSGDEPYTVLQNGSLQLQLYVDENGHWIPPPSAWTVGSTTYEGAYAQPPPFSLTIGSTYEGAYAHVVPNGVGSAIVEPGPPVNEELWGGTVVVTPFGTYSTTNTDLTQYTYPAVVDLNNGTRYVFQGIYINGEEVSENALASVPLGSLVYEDYEKQYLVTQTSAFGTQSTWVNAGTQFAPNASSYVINGVTFEPVEMLINNNVYEPITPITTLTANAPMNITIYYLATANVSTTAWGMPALYASASLTCGSGVATATGFLTSELTVSMLNPPTYKCTITTITMPVPLFIAIIAAVIIIAFVLITRRVKRK